MRTIIVASLLILLAAVACGSEAPEPVAATEPTTTVASSLPTNTPFSPTAESTATPEPTNATRPITPTPTPTVDEVTNTPTPTATPESVTMTLDCEDERFIEEIVKLSEDSEGPFQARILKLYEGSEELERTESVLRCKAEARLSNLTDSYIIYHVEIDRDGDQFIGYRIGDPIASPTPEPTAPSPTDTPVPSPTVEPTPTSTPTDMAQDAIRAILLKEVAQLGGDAFARREWAIVHAFFPDEVRAICSLGDFAAFMTLGGAFLGIPED